MKLGVHRPIWSRGLHWLTKVQSPDGGVPVSQEFPSPCWPTALAIIAWQTAASHGQNDFTDSIDRGVGWLLHHHGRSFPRDPTVFGHDTTLTGWPWVAGTHSWVEPTSYAILALRHAGRADYHRVREAIRLLIDRALPDGGWNYGNTRVYQNTLRPFPGTTGIALCALAGEPRSPCIDGSIRYLSERLPGVRAPWSLGWGILGLSTWNACPDDAAGWLAESAARATSQVTAHTLDLAMLLQASQALSSATTAADLLGVP